ARRAVRAAFSQRQPTYAARFCQLALAAGLLGVGRSGSGAGPRSSVSPPEPSRDAIQSRKATSGRLMLRLLVAAPLSVPRRFLFCVELICSWVCFRGVLLVGGFLGVFG